MNVEAKHPLQHEICSTSRVSTGISMNGELFGIHHANLLTAKLSSRFVGACVSFSVAVSRHCPLLLVVKIALANIVF